MNKYYTTVYIYYLIMARTIMKTKSKKETEAAALEGSTKAPIAEAVPIKASPKSAYKKNMNKTSKKLPRAGKGKAKVEKEPTEEALNSTDTDKKPSNSKGKKRSADAAVESGEKSNVVPPKKIKKVNGSDDAADNSSDEVEKPSKIKQHRSKEAYQRRREKIRNKKKALKKKLTGEVPSEAADAASDSESQED